MKKEVEIQNQVMAQLPADWLANITLLPAGPYDAELTLEFGGFTRNFHVESKYIHRKETLDHYAKQCDTASTLLFCNPLSDFLRDYCQQQNINYIDAAGNARIVGDGVYVLLQGNAVPPRQPSVPGMSIGIMKCLFAFFADDELISQPYSKIADRAGISVGMVSKAMGYLTEHQFIPGGKKGRRLLDKTTLAYQWLIAYPTVLKPKLSTLVLEANQHWQKLATEPGDVWIGEVAASQLTDYLEAEQWLLFTQQPLQQKIRQYRSRPDPNGKLTVANAFWGEALTLNTFANALLSTAELLASQDGRNREVAEILNEQYLHLKQLP
ncbi:hypothetical protein C9I98_03345 [Photobacterium sanctipauli]|uniref:Uncharacterized protein n=2 Tax=Photobacterium sanctipauli TaxID=1342794 RepID=A0A2T3NZ66_9GAMM|nr:type IV toxin-antitoxin system AbiEi family antitoxin [Photobacterium sanctipauli]PSW21530.1 hypothetical protein C9I98_03345 [Photobacterium sanctipauli]